MMTPKQKNGRKRTLPNTLQLLLIVSVAACLLPLVVLEKHNNVVDVSALYTTLASWSSLGSALPLSDTNTTKPKRIRNKYNRTRWLKPLNNLKEEELRLEKLNSVDYYACCGLGHRLTKLTDAWYVSRQLNFALKTFWGFCDEQTEVFHHLFGPQPPEEIINATPGDDMVVLRNEVPGMTPLERITSKPCMCRDDKIQLDLQLYRSLFKRFRFHDHIAEFKLRHHWNNHTVIGMHVRAGNGETGDFIRKKRGIHNMRRWIRRVANRIKEYLELHSIQNPLLYIATDTPSMIPSFRESLEEVAQVIDLPQKRAESGVLFGEMSAVTQSGSICLTGWIQATMDLIMLSSASIVIAARPSSFVQSMPMSLLLGRGDTYCEIPPNAVYMNCYRNFRDWCCGSNSSTNAILGDIQLFEYIRMPNGPVDISRIAGKIRKRRSKELILPMFGSSQRLTDLPYSWTNLVAKVPGKKGRR
jgi:hypothetical protein